MTMNQWARIKADHPQEIVIVSSGESGRWYVGGKHDVRYVKRVLTDYTEITNGLIFAADKLDDVVAGLNKLGKQVIVGEVAHKTLWDGLPSGVKPGHG